MKYILLILAFYGVFCQRYQPMLEFTEAMEQCGDLMCNGSLTCDFVRNATCLGRVCRRVECVPIMTKVGRCPAPKSSLRLDCDALAEYLPDCYEDNHCTGMQKCCVGRCRFKECQNPIFATRRSTTVRPVPNSPPVLLLAGGARANNAFIEQALARANDRYSKQGMCPSAKSSWFRSICSLMASQISTCQSDRDCSGDRKCCPGRCNLQECTMAEFKTNGTATIVAERPVRTNQVTKKVLPATTIVVPLVTQSVVTVPSIIIRKQASVKPGTCPPNDLQNWQFFCSYLSTRIKTCQVDNVCPEVQKCCPGRCSLKECKTPLLTVTRDRSVFFQDGPDLVTDRPDPVPVTPRVPSCPVEPPSSTPGGTLNLFDMFVCSLMYSNQPTCRNHAECVGGTMCCRTRCKDFRCTNPVYS